MIVKFGKDYLRDLFETGKCSDKHHRFQPSVVKKYALRVVTLQNAPDIETLFPLNSLNYEELTVDTEQGEPAVTICTILEISNHYK